MNNQSLTSLIDDIRLGLKDERENLLTLFDIYANEAVFGREWLDEDLRNLPAGSEVLEIGAGMMLLACQLVREGYVVTALEPVGEGFSHFHHLQQYVLEYATAHGFAPAILPCPGEELAQKNHYAFAYSLNVMEHVTDVSAVIERVYAALAPGGEYHFLCPNYAFPYETHFSMPTFGTKALTWRLMKDRVLNSKLEDAMGLWKSLNWITVAKVKCICDKLLIKNIIFSTRIMQTYIGRAFTDVQFQARHGRVIRYMLLVLRRLGMLSLIQWIPARFMPVMDCRIRR